MSIKELHVEAPEEVTEGETADLTCNTTCSLTDPTFIWYKDGRPLTTKTIKNNQLQLQTVSSEDAGSYSCAVRGSQHLRSIAHSLRVRLSGQNYSIINITADHTGLYYCEAQNDHGALRSAGVPVSSKGYPVILYVTLGVFGLFMIAVTAGLWRLRRRINEFIIINFNSSLNPE
ncbi:hypothetical protein MHYP_G00102810 [Metynnis hypsauchen]